uniref:Arf-GAP with coiled-coil, ANK repeat and PH domain-containing protein n=1 Tax=Peronospora matthiolae TaxID=2874970 RepID=A0AAV1TXW8_9STRA
MKAFNTWRGADGANKGASDAVAELQQVIVKKDRMILSLQTQLDAYAARFGALPRDILDQWEQANAPAENPSRGVNCTRTEVTAASDTKRLRDGTPNWKVDTSATSPVSRKVQVDCDLDESQENGPKSCSSTNVVLDFVEDSPMFRCQVEGFEESITGLRALLKELVTHSKEYAAAGKHFGAKETALADELVQRKHARAIFSTSCSELGSLSDLFGEMHDTLAQVQSSRVSMLLGVESLLSRLIQQFLDQDVLKEAGERRKEVTKLGEEYETLLGKLLSKPRQPGQAYDGTGTPTGWGDLTGLLGLGSPVVPVGSHTGASDDGITTRTPAASAAVVGNGSNVVHPDAGKTTSEKHQRALERDVLVARRKFELARFDLVRCLNRIDWMKKFVLVECFNSIMYAQLGHFHACHELVKSVEPTLRKRQEMMQVSRQGFERDELMWTSQRDLLDTRLSQHVDIVSSNLESIEHVPDSSDVASDELLISSESFLSLDLPVEVISLDTSMSRETLATSPDGAAKQGYLFVRNSMFPARSWKRRWFQIHAGKLFQTTCRSGGGKRSTESSLTLVCNLLLARVRELESSSLPFCFEVIDANRSAKLLLQAASTRDMVEWIEAARRSTENALEKQSHRQEVHPKQQSIIDMLTKASPCCADCGQEPAEWVSINIGCLLCIECSGIHRSLGVHESKVRSLTLDSWDMALLTLLQDDLGNDAVNAVWEHTIPDGWTKPTPTASWVEKAQFIKAKYHFHKFVELDRTLDAPKGNDSIMKRDLAKRFITGASRGNVKELMWCLAHGVDINVRAGEQNETALHVSAAAGAVTCCNYLVVNGASLTITDKRGRSPYDAANAEEIKVALMQKMNLEQHQV